MRSAGQVMDPWQDVVLEQGMGELAGGRWASTEVDCWVSRQNGKGGIIEAVVCYALFVAKARTVIWTAHLYRTAMEGFLRIKELIRNTPSMYRLVRRVWEGSGEEGIELVTGQRLMFMARSKGGGRGFTCDLLILDEAQYLTALVIQAVYSALSAVPNPQIWYFGTPPTDPAAWCYGLRKDGAAGAPRMSHFDWGVDLNLDDPKDRARVGDLELLYQANPALGIRLTEEYCLGELRRLGQVGYAMERLGVWLPPVEAGGDSPVSPELWADLAVDPQRPADVAFAVDVNPRRSHSAILSVGPRDDGLLQISVVEYRPGTAWVVDRLVELKAAWNPVAFGLDAKGPAGSLLLDLEKVGITQPANPDRPLRGDLAVPTAAETAQAYGLLVDALTERRAVHLDEEPLNAAVAGAATRPLGGGSAWDRKGDADICPLVAATVAHWAYLTRVEAVADYDVADSFA